MTTKTPPFSFEKSILVGLSLLALAAVLVTLFTEHVYPTFYMAYVQGERGAVEALQFFVLAAFTVTAFLTLRHPYTQHPSIIKYWLILAALCGFYVAMEEISWGQWIFLWQTPDAWLVVNDQQETNLHNTSSWFDQKPRMLMEVGIVLGGIILPLLLRFKPSLRKTWWGILVPSCSLLFLALLGEVVTLEKRLIRPLLSYEYLVFFERPSELQELCYYTFALAYLYDLRDRLRR